jgi:hypothetical protein
VSQVTTCMLRLSVFMTYNRVSNQNNTTGATCGVGSAYPSESPEFTPVVSVVRVTRSLVLCVMFCRLLFVLYLFLLAIVLSILLRFTSSDFGIMNLKTSPKIQSTNCKICKQWYDKPSKIENIHDDSGGHKSNKRKQRNSKNVYKPYD